MTTTAVHQQSQSELNELEQDKIKAEILDALKAGRKKEAAELGEKLGIQAVIIPGSELKADSYRRSRVRLKNQRTKAKKARFSLFTEWLLQTYGSKFLASGAGLIDVAGGRGRMALEFCIDRQIPCTVVDPLPGKFSAFTTRRIIDAAKMAATLPTSADNNSVTIKMINPDASMPTTDAVMMKPSILLNDQECSRNTQEVLDLTHLYMEAMGFAYHKCLFNSEYCGHQPNLHDTVEEGDDDDDVEVSTALPFTNVAWTHISMVIGMHPDEATESIVDEAIRANKSFAVVPCCVFPTLFPHRLMENKTLVRSLAQFIIYLMAKDARIKLHVLDEMPGCNTIVYMKV